MTSSGWTRQRRCEYRQTTVQEPWGATDNTFEFALTERNGETLLQFTQEYAQELSDETYGTYNFNWGYYLNSLKLLCETGAGTSFVPPV